MTRTNRRQKWELCPVTRTNRPQKWELSLHNWILLVLTILTTSIPCAQSQCVAPTLTSNTVTDQSGNSADAGSQISWGSLPSGKAYVSTDEFEAGSLKPLYDFSQSFINTSMPADLPETGLFDQFDYLVLLNHAKGYVAAVAFGFLFVVVFTLTGFCFCCCRCCCGNCGGQMKQAHDDNANCKRITFSVILLVLIAFITTGMVMVFLTNEEMTKTAGRLVSVFSDGIDDMKSYIDNTYGEINHLTRTNFLFTKEVFFRDLDSRGFLLGIPIQDAVDAGAGVTTGIAQASDLGNTIATAKTEFDAVNAATTTLENNVALLQTDLAAVQQKLDDAIALCGTVPCNAINTADLVPEFDPSLMPDISGKVTAIDTAAATDHTAVIAGVTEEFDKIPCQVHDDSATTVNDLKQQITDAQNTTVEDLLKQVDTLRDASGGLDLNTLLNTLETYTDEYVIPYNTYRWQACIALASIILLITLLLFLGLMFGCCGHVSGELPTQRGCVSNTGGLCLMAAVGFIFIFSWILMLITTILYAVGGPLERWGCQPLGDFDSFLYKEILDKKDGFLGEGYFVAGAILQNNTVPLTIGGILKDCRDGKATWDTLKLDHLLDLDTFSTFIDDINVATELAALNVDFTSVVVTTPAMTNQLNELSNAAAISGDYANFNSELLKSPVKQSNLGAFANSIRGVANAPGAAAAQADLNSAADDLDTIEAGSKQDVLDSQIALGDALDALKLTTDGIPAKVTAVSTTLGNIDTYIQTSAAADVIAEATIYGNRLLGTISTYITKLLASIKTDVAKCTPVYRVFNSMINIGFCGYFLDVLNGFWLCLGWCVFFFIPSVIFAVKLAKHFRRMDSNDGMIGGIPPNHVAPHVVNGLKF